MSKLIFTNIFRFVILIALQVMILNYVYLGGYILPFIYILAVMMLPTRVGNIPLLIIAFVAGMVVDMFCNVPGFHTFSCTMMAFGRIVIGNRMLTRDDPDAVIDMPCIREVPFQSFFSYAFVLALIYCITYGLIESFSFGNFGLTLLMMLVNTIASMILIMLSQLFITQKKEGRL